MCKTCKQFCSKENGIRSKRNTTLKDERGEKEGNSHTFNCIFPDRVGTSTVPPRIACKKI